MPFDPDAPRDGVQVERSDGRLVCFAPCVAAVGYTDKAAASAHAKAQKQHKKATKEELAAQRTLSAAEVAAGLPQGNPPQKAPAAKVIQGFFKQRQPKEAISEAQKARFNQGLANSMEAPAAGRAVESIARKTNPRHRGPKNCLKGEPVSGNALGAVEDGLEICFTGQRTVGTGPVLPQS